MNLVIHTHTHNFEHNPHHFLFSLATYLSLLRISIEIVFGAQLNSYLYFNLFGGHPPLFLTQIESPLRSIRIHKQHWIASIRRPKHLILHLPCHEGLLDICPVSRPITKKKKKNPGLLLQKKSLSEKCFCSPCSFQPICPQQIST